MIVVKKIGKFVFYAGAMITWIALIAWLIIGDSFTRTIKERQSELIGGMADRFIASQSSPAKPENQVKTVEGLHHIEIKVDQFQENIFRASGVANSYLIKTDTGHVLFDTGLATQAAKHKRLLQQAAPGKVSHIILSHSHADHIGATKFWRAEFPEAKIITHRKFDDGQRYLKDLEQYFWDRNRTLYTFMPENPPEPDSLFAYGNISADILLDDHSEYRFSSGGVEFVVLPTPGAEGEDNIVLWLPQQKALFSGDFFGPLFPMMPNLFTLRGEKFRDPVRYIDSLNSVLQLSPKIILPSHFDPIEGEEIIAADVQLMRDATDYVHQQTIDGMNQGKNVWQLMQEITLPEHLSVSQGHGKVSWNVRSIWEYYSTWFHFESTTELYPIPIKSLYKEIAQLIGDIVAILNLANTKLQQQQPEQALHLVEIVLAADANNVAALEIRLSSLEQLKTRSQRTTANFSEMGWLKARINATKHQLNEIQNEQ